ncbi:MAG: 50S ribosomal protein L31 [Actinobacteria bacterium]|nr:50S ribosomal protein L31 [Actinomycetota bacterium]
MKKDIHPKYMITKVICACGNVFETRSTMPEIHVEVCNLCHPFYTGTQRVLDTGGRVQRFKDRYQAYYEAKEKAEAEEATGSEQGE